MTESSSNIIARKFSFDPWIAISWALKILIVLTAVIVVVSNVFQYKTHQRATCLWSPTVDVPLGAFSTTIAAQMSFSMYSGVGG